MTVSLGSLSLETSLPTGTSVVVARTDPTNSANLIFDRVSVAALTAGISLPDGNVEAIEIGVLNLVVAPSITADTPTAVPLYQITDVNDDSNLLLEQIELAYQDDIGAKVTYEVWAGMPGTDGAQKLAEAGQDIFFTQYTPEFRSSATAFLNNAALRDGLWLNVINRLTSTVKFSAKLSFLKLPPVAAPVTLPTYTSTPFVYTGPGNLTTVEVGPGQTFPTHADAMPYVAAGAFTMNVHAGQYFKPFLVPPGHDGFVIQAAAGVTADQIVCNGRGGWVTGQPVWTENASPGDGPVNPFRLAQGKGFMLVRSPGTIRKHGFWYNGGGLGRDLADNIGDGEAGIYAELFAASGTLTVERCTFDGNENGIFVPSVSGFGANVKLAIDRCDFSYQVANGQSPDGLSHNVYVSGAEVHATNSNFYGCAGNSFKSRSPIVTIDNSFLEASAGRCIDYPEGGTLTVTGSILSQKPDAKLQHNLVGLSNENLNNGAAHATFSGCVVKISGRDGVFLIKGSGAYAHFNPAGGTASTVEWYPDALRPGAAVGLSYDTEFGSATTGVDGLPGQSGSTLPYGPVNGGTVKTGAPVRPSPAHLT